MVRTLRCSSTSHRRERRPEDPLPRVLLTQQDVLPPIQDVLPPIQAVPQ